MAYEQMLRNVGVPASADLSASQFCFVKVNSSGQLALPIAGGDADGVLQDKPSAQYQEGSMAVLGISKVKVGSGGVTAGDLVATDASGCAVTATTGKKVVGRAMATGVQGVLVPVLIQQKSQPAPGPMQALFLSAEQTATGSPQNVAHGLASAPTGVLITITACNGSSADPFVVTEGSHTSTNVVVTITANAKFKVMAWI